ncbi:methyltransferase domain-containing protein [Candidatus Deianiraea vastatrix]|uniref:Malonyl-CoA O-methyltransferase BioC n=1 Tax=Candidatus Deianiraea vastatrix TaxID=2163644 RepID=A0A5B8XFM1_9RICK|nr:methyltransferase domain-containing protein [Candidatus Deianiraea vastatrix]QED23174.1 Malonyl-CoA O-methyltransferase BioC [Candidatus Deianiraea vastatrix]
MRHDVTKNIANKFDKYAISYDENAYLQSQIADYFSLFIQKNCINIDKICEIGCGTGNLTQKISKIFTNSSITALDISKNSIEIAKKKVENSNVKFKIESAINCKYTDYDGIISSMSLHWLGENLLEFLKTLEVNYAYFAIPVENSLMQVKNRILELGALDTITKFPKNADIIEVLGQKFNIKSEIFRVKTQMQMNKAIKNLAKFGTLSNNRNSIANIKKILEDNKIIDIDYEVLMLFCERK